MNTVDLETGLDKPSRRVKILYTNWKGVVAWRIISPQLLKFQSTPWHPEEQWIIHAFDHEKQALRSFAIKDIHKWEVVH